MVTFNGARKLQTWLNERGANLVVDGRFGPKSRAALLGVFRNTNAPAVTDADIAALARRLGCTTRQIRAVAKVESGGSGWDKTGLLACLWERHWLWRRVKLKVPGLSDPTPGDYTMDANRNGINDSWEKLARGVSLFGEVAFECASFGKFQIMGGHWKALGYDSPLDFAWRLSRDEAAHYDAFARYIEANGLLNALRRVSGNPDACRGFAKAYNGAAYYKLNYHGKIAQAYRRLG